MVPDMRLLFKLKQVGIAGRMCA